MTRNHGPDVSQLNPYRSPRSSIRMAKPTRDLLAIIVSFVVISLLGCAYIFTSWQDVNQSVGLVRCVGFVAIMAGVHFVGFRVWRRQQAPNPIDGGTEAPCDSIQASSPSHASFCGAAKAVLCCLGVHAAAVARWVFLDVRPDWIDDLFAVFLVFSTVVGVVCGVSAIRHRGFVNRAIGILGLLWFGFYVTLAILES